MTSALSRPALGMLAAIVVTTTMDASSLANLARRRRDERAETASQGDALYDE